MKVEHIQDPGICERWNKESSDEALLTDDRAARFVFYLHLITTFENELLRLQKDGILYGPLHPSIGEEANAVAMSEALLPGDTVNGSHRAHHHFLGKVLSYYMGHDWDPRLSDLSDQAQVALQAGVAEILGLQGGCCSGRGGSMHLLWPEAGFLGSNGIVGGGVPAATGFAHAHKRDGHSSIAMAFMGDGAVNQGSFHEACNLAALWDLPVIFVVENNLYAVGTKTSAASSVSDLALRGKAYGMDSVALDGTDMLGLYAGMKRVVDQTRSTGKPHLIEIRSYRHLHHDSSLPGSAYGYREKKEETDWLSRDPVASFPEEAIAKGMLTRDDVELIKRKAKDAINAVFHVLGGPSLEALPDDAWPRAESIGIGLRSDGSEFSVLNYRVPDRIASREMKYVDAIAKITGRWLEREPKAFVLGEDVANFRKGPYGATRDLMKQFPDRVLNTPISEAGFVGLGFGASMLGMRPIVEIMFPDFVLVAADQLFSQVGKARYMYGSRFDVPLVVRTRVATGTGMGPQHSMDPVGLFAMFSGWRIVAPSNALDYIGLFNSAMHSLDPVLILEHHSLYGSKFAVPPEDDWDFAIPFGKAAVTRSGKDATVLCYGGLVPRVNVIAIQLMEVGIDLEVIDLRTLDYESIDYGLIDSSLEKTGHLVIVEEAARSQGIGGHLLERVCNSSFEKLRTRPQVITSPDLPVAASKRLESAILLSDASIERSLKEGVAIRHA